jgi:hypothetical protein
MDERRTLTILGWIIFNLLAAIFLLNAMVLSDSAPPAHSYGMAAADDPGYGVGADPFGTSGAARSAD